MFKVNELLEVTGGRLISGRQKTVIKGISIDSRTTKKGEAFIAIKGDNFDGHDFIEEAINKKAAAVIVQSSKFKVQSPKKIPVIKVKDTVRALGDIARLKRSKFDIPVIAVTGSNGKTTAKEMIAWVLSKKFKVLKNEGTKNNQIGLPLALLGLNSNYDMAVLELGTNHFGEIGYLARVSRPNIGVITNIGPSHLEHLRNLRGVFCEKYALIKNLKSPNLAILNSDDPLLRKQILKKSKRPMILSFGIKNRGDFSVSGIKDFSGILQFYVNLKYKFRLKTLGYFNIYNALTAIIVARIFGIEYKDIASQIGTFKFPARRLSPVAFNKIKFIDDTYNSNPGSLRQALDALDNLRAEGRKIFVMGDMLELGSRKRVFHCQAGQRVGGICDVFITVGKLSKLAAEAAASRGFDIRNLFTCASIHEARDVLFNKISVSPKDIVLVKGSRLMRMEEIFDNR